MRYLAENHDYKIMYHHGVFMIFGQDSIYATLLDKKTDKVIEDEEIYNGDLEKCLIKLGKRLIKKWRKKSRRK